MPLRRLLGVLVLGGLVLAGLVLPAETATAQAPPPTITPAQDSAATPPPTWSIRVQDSGWGRFSVSISFDGQVMATPTPTGGVVDTVITPARRAAGTYPVTISGNPCAPTASCPTTRTASFRSIPTSSFNDPCGPAGSTVTITVTGDNFPPKSFGYVFYDRGGPDEQSQQRIPTNSGTFTASFSVVVPSRSITINVYDVGGNTAPDLVWRPRPCPATTTTTSTSTTTTSTTAPEETTTTTRPSSSTTTTRPGSTTTTIAVPPVELPPPTPGATLTLTPKLGPTGFVTGVRGTGFPPNTTVQLHWQPGVGSATALVGADGTFATRVLVLPNDQLGPRALVATSGATTALDGFLVVPSTVQPSGGQNVAQITRIRRFLKR